MDIERLEQLFSQEKINNLFPKNKADQFFEALYGDPSEGAYNIDLFFKEQKENSLIFEFHLTQRPGKCLRCNLTYGREDGLLRKY